MASFKDSEGREWRPALNTYLLEQIEARVGVNIDDLLDDDCKGLVALFKSSVKVVRVLWVLCEDQANKAGVQPESFGKALAGDNLEEARTALYKAIADFYPPQTRKVLLALGEKGEIVKAERVGEVLKRIEEFDWASSKPVTVPAESSESIPLG